MTVSRIRGVVRLVLATCLIGVAAACAAPPASVVPTVRPTPVVTPDPHLSSPASADDVYRALNVAGLRVTANNANAGEPGTGLLKRINATYLGWPLTIGQYQTEANLRDQASWPSGSVPGQGEPPVSVVGLNILIQWGPTTGAQPATPNQTQLDGLPVLVEQLDALLSPLRGRTSIAIDRPGFTPAPPASVEPEATPSS
jgi:hypothetical protein